jgi:hypothetical protein
VILMYIKNIKWLNYLRSIDKWHFDSLEKTTLPPLARHLFSAVKDIMVNTLSESTMFLLTYYRKSLSHISFFLVSCRLLVHFSTIYNALEVRPDLNKPKKSISLISFKPETPNKHFRDLIKPVYSLKLSFNQSKNEIST